LAGLLKRGTSILLVFDWDHGASMTATCIPSAAITSDLTGARLLPGDRDRDWAAPALIAAHLAD